VKRERISKLRLEWNNYTITIINVYMPNMRLNKAKTIEMLRTHLESEQKRNNLLVVSDFNLVTDEQDRLPPHLDNPGLVDR